tara:strand:- start:214 stop:927 length:714 start_codon:yes stop_codon:yes gene_type:complete
MKTNKIVALVNGSEKRYNDMYEEMRRAGDEPDDELRVTLTPSTGKITFKVPSKKATTPDPAAVLKIVLDHRFLEMRREVEVLKLDIFWLKHGKAKLAYAMQCFNLALTPLPCNCVRCIRGDRLPTRLFEDFLDFQPDVCQWQAPFENFVTECGLSVALRTGETREIMDSSTNIPPKDHHESDVHFSPAKADFVLYDWDDWVHFGIGYNLWSCECINAKQLKRYQDFLEACIDKGAHL